MITKTQKAVDTILRYHQRIQTAERRKRGNPPDVLEAVEYLRGGKVCEICDATKYEKRIELHHRDGNWKNYTLENLGFYCSDCHLDDHNGCWSIKPSGKEMYMQNVVTKMSWSGQIGDILITKVDGMTTEGYSIEEACRELSKDSVTLFGRQLTGDSLSSTYHRVRRIMRERSGDLPAKTFTQKHTGGRIMSFDDLCEIAKLKRQYNITLTN